MDRRGFIRTGAAAAAVLAVPEWVAAAISGLTESEIERKVVQIVAQMTLDEKIKQMAGHVPLTNLAQRVLNPKYPDTWNTPENDRLGVPSIRSIDGPRGCGTGKSTAFPAGMCRGATWDEKLEQRVGEAAGYECRAQTANLLLSPCVNVLWHPSWGRAQETYGEDPHHLGIMGAAHVTGAQKHVMACPKHFAANNIEESRFSVNAVMDERTLREIYLPHFRKCVEAGAASVMSAYNDLNGELCGHNEHLLRDVLKGDWEFEGFVVSDWIMAVEDEVEAALAGLDLEMPRGTHFGRKLKKAVLNGEVPEQVIDEAVSRILRMKFRFIKPDFTEGYDMGMVGGEKHAALARETAEKGIVLLKNDNKALPLLGDVKTLAVGGGHAARVVMGDKGSSAVNPPYAVSPLEGIESKAGGRVKIIKAGSSPSSAASAAGKADAAVLFVGLDWKDEGEHFPIVEVGGDRKDLGLSKKDVKLIKSVAASSERCIVVVYGGSAITMEDWKDDVDAIVMAWYPGMEGGSALANVLFGDVNPSGKLPIVFPKSMDQLYKFDNKAKEVHYDYYHGYRYFDKNGLEPAWPFGFGKSYTTYEYSNLRLSEDEIGSSGSIKAKVDVKNAGDMAGEEIVELYVGYQGSEVHRPVKDLKAFARVRLEPGRKETVALEIRAQDLAYYSEEVNDWVVEEIEYEVMVGPSSKEEDLIKAGFKIFGP